MSISVAMIVRDEEAVLQRCLESMFYPRGDELVPLWDELVVCDTGSDDHTKEIALSYGATVIDFPWVDDMSAARNYVESRCEAEWIYMQDADEVLLDGHKWMRDISDHGSSIGGFRPSLIYAWDETGHPTTTFFRQELFHKNNGKWKWVGAAHEYLVTDGVETSADAPQIVVRHAGRPGADRPNHKDIFQALRSNLGTGFGERDLFYLIREHHYAGHHQEAIGLAEVLLQQPVLWPMERSHACILMGTSYVALGDTNKARLSYIRALQECSTWAEPYFALGRMCYDLKEWEEAAAWLYASLPFTGERGHFSDKTLYSWQRYDLLAVCLWNLGRKGEAKKYGKIALDARPDDKRLQDNMRFYANRRKA